MFAHEHVIIANSGTRDFQPHYTGESEFFRTEQAAQNSADNLNRLYGLGLTVYQDTPE